MFGAGVIARTLKKAAAHTFQRGSKNITGKQSARVRFEESRKNAGMMTGCPLPTHTNAVSRTKIVMQEAPFVSVRHDKIASRPKSIYAQKFSHPKRNVEISAMESVQDIGFDKAHAALLKRSKIFRVSLVFLCSVAFDFVFRAY